MGYVGLLLSLLFYIYAVVGAHLFGGSDDDFGSISTALLTLFRIVTLDNWGDIFNRALMHAPFIKVAIYFVTFIVLGTMIILNLFIGVIINSMSEMHAEIAEGAQRQGFQPGDQPKLDEQLLALERELRSLQERIQQIRKTNASDKPRRFRS
jgi:voltage-gated sodium channel